MMTLNDVRPQGKGKGGMDALLGGKGKGKMNQLKKLGESVKALPPLRSYDDPANKAMGDALMARRVPEELRPADEDTQITVAPVGDMTYEEFKQMGQMFEQMFSSMAAKGGDQGSGKGSSASSSASPPLFTGAGQTLGGSSAGSAAPAAGGATTSAGAGGPGCDPAVLALVKGQPAPAVDEAKPATTLQLRLSTGTRVKARLNLDHTVADLWRLVAQNMGEAAFAAASGHELSAGFPPKPLTDPTATLQAADLVNAAVTHRSR